MSIGITDEHGDLGGAVRRFLDRHCPPEVARAGLDAATEEVPPFWSALAETGWLGLAIAASQGGQGFGLAEAAVLLEELGRVAAPGPFLPTLAAGVLIARGTATRDEPTPMLAGLADGTIIGTVAFPAAPALEASAPAADGSLIVTGQVRPILSAALADLFVVRAAGPHGERWCVLNRSDAQTVELASLDPSRRTGSLAVSDVIVPASHQLALTTAEVEGILAGLVAAESAGSAVWCLDTAVEYAQQRVQFGRPIGQFQAVKHRGADMLVAVEAARAVAWDAAAAIDQVPPGQWSDEAELATAVAAAVAPAAFFGVAKDCIQILGGLGFTWEHDAQRYLRRATAMRQLLGGPGPGRRRAARLATAGTRRVLSIDLPASGADLRDRIKADVDAIAALPREERRRALVDSGLFVPHWPEPWGRQAGPTEQLVIDEEMRRAGLRRANLAVGAWAAPTIAAHGTMTQQERWVGPTLHGQVIWCQLFSEPGAGSDLAALTTRADRTEGGWLINGQKVWTSQANEADWGICLARTNRSAPKHLGITYFVVDMKAEGIDIRPLRELTGLAMFNEVFLTDVFVPDDAVIGEVDGGWPLARTTLANERVAMGSGASFGGGLEALLRLIGSSPVLDDVQMDQLGALVAEAHTVGLLGQRATLRAVAGGTGGAESSVRKLLSAEHDQRTQEFGLGLLGPEGATTDGVASQWTFGFLANRCLTIAGGTSEIQRNVIAERLLGLPRDP